MTVRRLEHIGVVVEDLEAAVAFFAALGLESQGDGTVEGDWVDRIVGLECVRSHVAMMHTPDGHGRLELIEYERPLHEGEVPRTESNTPGINHLLFAVEDIDDALGRLRPHGAQLVGEVERYEDRFRLCYVRGPAGIIVELAEELG